MQALNLLGLTSPHSAVSTILLPLALTLVLFACPLVLELQEVNDI